MKVRCVRHLMIAFLSVLGIAPASAAMPDDHDFVVRCCDICTAFGREGILAGSPPRVGLSFRLGSD